MKNWLLTLGYWLWMQSAFSQAPASFSYQAVARDTLGNLWVNQALIVRISIRHDSANGSVDYKELHQTTTNVISLPTTLRIKPWQTERMDSLSLT